MKNFYILGSGSLGLLFGYHLSNIFSKLNSNTQLKIITRNYSGKERIELSKKDQLPEYSDIIDFITLDEVNDSIENILIATKTAQALDFLKNEKDRISSHGNVYCLQNGMGIFEYAEHSAETWNLFQIIVTEGAYRPAPETDPFHVYHAGTGLNLMSSLKALDKDHDFLKTDFKHHPLLDIPIDIEVKENLKPYLYKKLIINCGINALTAKYQVKNGEILKLVKAHNELKMLCNEMDLLVQAKAWPVDQASIDLVSNIATQTADNYSSTYQDYDQGKESELAYMNGFLLREAKELNINMPAHTKIMSDLKVEWDIDDY